MIISTPDSVLSAPAAVSVTSATISSANSAPMNRSLPVVQDVSTAQRGDGRDDSDQKISINPENWTPPQPAGALAADPPLHPTDAFLQQLEK
ncbi:MAG: hypothetical protein AAFN70_13585, partial [Planctomycetota bacterium]